MIGKAKATSDKINGLRIRSWISVVRDITERKRSEEELRQSAGVAADLLRLQRGRGGLFEGQRVAGFIQKPYTATGIAENMKVCSG